jgi:predicted transcriptional regulator YheO
MHKNKTPSPSDARNVLGFLEPIVDCVADLFGPNCEVVLHDVRDPSHSVIKIRNGHVTGRKIGSPLTDLGLEMLNKPRFRGNTLGTYLSRTSDGRMLKCNAVMIRDGTGNIIGQLCINVDITALLSLQQMLGPLPADEKPGPYTEHYGKDVPTLIRGMIDDVISRNGKHKKIKEERLGIVRELYARGIFNIRGAVHLVAKALDISSVSVYKYLEEIRY